MPIAAKLYQGERTAERHTVGLDATLRNPDRRPADVLVDDLSATGCRITGPVRLTVGDVVTIGVAAIGRRGARVVRRAADGYGCEFEAPLGAGELAAALSGPVVNVHALAGAEAGVAADWTAEPVVEQLSRRNRLALLLVLGAGSWVALIAGARALVG